MVCKRDHTWLVGGRHSGARETGEIITSGECRQCSEVRITLEWSAHRSSARGSSHIPKFVHEQRGKNGGSREQGSSQRPVGTGFHGAEVHWPQIAPPRAVGCAKTQARTRTLMTRRSHAIPQPPSR